MNSENYQKIEIIGKHTINVREIRLFKVGGGNKTSVKYGLFKLKYIYI